MDLVSQNQGIEKEQHDDHFDGNGYIYILTSDYKKTIPRRKIGLTTLPHHRLHTYMTSCCDMDELYFEKIYHLKISSHDELRRIESCLHYKFSKLRKVREWFEFDSPDLVDAFIRTFPSFVKECVLDEIPKIQYSKNALKRERALEKYRDEIETIPVIPVIPVNVNAANDPSGEYEYFAHMLNIGQVPRRIQVELFRAFSDKVMKLDTYKGIVQWPTAVGKTIGMLSLLFITFRHYININASKKDGNNRFWRGLLIAPQNDILNTIIDSIKKLEKWNITIVMGHDAQFLDTVQACPLDKHCLIITTHASLTERKKWEMLPEIHHFHYDEVHGSTGLQFYGLLTEWIPKFAYFTGTSATPKTCNSDQHARLHHLFGNPLSVLHQCEMDEAVKEGWIALPKLITNIVDTKTRIPEFIASVFQSVDQKRKQGKWKYGKVIVYLETISDVVNAVRCAKQYFDLHWHDSQSYTMYMAVKDDTSAHNPEPNTSNIHIQIDGVLSDTEFIKDEADGSLRILFACQRYRQGSDIKGIEMTMILFNSTIATNVIVQVIGRALRQDTNYDKKEGWCVIVKTRDDGEADNYSQDVLSSILLEFSTFVVSSSLGSRGDESTTISNKHRIKEFVEQFIVHSDLDDTTNTHYAIQETVERLQHMYLRKEFISGAKGIREYCNERAIDSSFEYAEHRKMQIEGDTGINLPIEIPCRSNESIFEFFHPNNTRIDRSVFVQTLKEHELTTSQKYETWRSGHLEYPSVQHINDGYFGNGVNETNFNSFVEPKRGCRR